MNGREPSKNPSYGGVCPELASDTEYVHQTFCQQQVEWLRTMRQDPLAHYNTIGRGTDRYILSRSEPLVEAILRTVI